MGNNPSEDFFFGSGGRAAKFHNPGDTLTGTVAATPQTRQQTDFKTGKPIFWDEEKTQPKMQLVVTVQTDQREDDTDDGLRNLYIKGVNLTEAFRQALRASNVKGIETGGRIQVRFTGYGESSGDGFNPPKEWACRYQAPQVSADVLDDPWQRQQPTQQAKARVPDDDPWAPAPKQDGPKLTMAEIGGMTLPQLLGVYQRFGIMPDPGNDPGTLRQGLLTAIPDHILDVPPF